MISQVFWTEDGRWAFQKVGKVYNLYDQDGDFVDEFTNFWKMCDWITNMQKEEMMKMDESIAIPVSAVIE